MQSVREAISGSGNMIFSRLHRENARRNSVRPYPLISVAPTEIHELIAALRSQFEKVKADAAFLALKKSELRPGNYPSLCGTMEAQEQLNLERSLLSGRAWMIQEMVTRKKITLDANSRKLLRETLRRGSGGLYA
jgi:hypothetical protein